MPESPPSRVPGPLQAGSSPTPHHQRLRMLFTPSPACIWLFRICRFRFSSHKPDLSPDQATQVSCGPASPQETEASRGIMMPDAVRIVLLPAAKVCQAPKRLQQRARGIFDEERFKSLRTRYCASAPKQKAKAVFALALLARSLREKFASAARRAK